MGQKKNWRLHLETVCLLSQGEKKKKGSNWRVLQTSLQRRVRNENYPGQLGRHLYILNIWLSSTSNVSLQIYFSVKEITSIFAHSHQSYIFFFKKYLQKQGLCQIQLHLFCTTSDTIQGESNIELGANYSGLKLKDNINLLNASDHLNQMVNIKFQCDEYSETRQGFRGQIGKKSSCRAKGNCQDSLVSPYVLLLQKDQTQFDLTQKGSSFTQRE